MKRRIGYGLAFAAATAGLAVVGWPGAPTDPATLINRVDMIAILTMLVLLPRIARSRYGPVRDSRLTRILRAGGCLALFALVLVKDDVQRFEYARLPGRSWLAGLWAGEILFLAVTAIYLVGLLAVTARRPPAGPSVLAVGTCAGAAAGLLVFALPPVGNPLHVTKTWLAVVHGLGWGVAVPLVLGGGIVAGLVAARKAAGRGGHRRWPMSGRARAPRPGCARAPPPRCSSRSPASARPRSCPIRRCASTPRRPSCPGRATRSRRSCSTRSTYRHGWPISRRASVTARRGTCWCSSASR